MYSFVPLGIHAIMAYGQQGLARDMHASNLIVNLDTHGHGDLSSIKLNIIACSTVIQNRQYILMIAVVDDELERDQHT